MFVTQYLDMIYWVMYIFIHAERPCNILRARLLHYLFYSFDALQSDLLCPYGVRIMFRLPTPIQLMEISQPNERDRYAG